MTTPKEIINFCNEAVFYNYKNIGIICELDPVRKFVFNRFSGTIPYTRILSTLSIIDDIILKVCNSDDENNLISVHNLRQNIVRMFSDERNIRNEIANGDDE